MSVATERPIGIFDSGVGGLSILRHVRTLLPGEHLIYLADAAFAPYGDRPEVDILARSLDVADHLVERGVKALVVACNTATAAAIETIRRRHPKLLVVGVEPGLKPAALASSNGLVGVLGTTHTLSSRRFLRLRDEVCTATGVRFLLQPCPGLADAIERGPADASDTASRVDALLRPLLQPLVAAGIDTLVLGCTHYPFVQAQIARLIAQERPGAPPVSVIDTGAAVACRLAAVLQAGGTARVHGRGTLHACATGDTAALSYALCHLLDIDVPVSLVTVSASALQDTSHCDCHSPPDFV